MGLGKGLHLAILTLGCIAVVVGLACICQAWTLIDSDDFTGLDGSDPDPLRWNVGETHSDDYVQIVDNSLKCHSQGNGYAYVTSVDHFTTSNVTILVDHMMTVRSGRSIDVRLVANASGHTGRWVFIGYDADAGYGTVNYRLGGVERSVSYYQDFVLGRWYTVNITVWTDTFNVTIRERDSGTGFLSITDRSCDPIASDNYVWLGVYQYHTTSRAEAFYDDFRLYDLNPPPNLAPAWGELPVLSAVEDVPRRYNFSANISDPDDRLIDLTLSSPSPYVQAIEGFEVTFLFPEGVLSASVPLVLSDGRLNATAWVEFIVTPLNDPPIVDIPTEHQAVEDVPLTIDFEGHVQDVDNEVWELELRTDDAHAAVLGLKLTVLFGEGELRHSMLVRVSDGTDDTPVQLNFTIEPVDDPPTIDAIDMMTVLEDQPTVLNVTPYLHDIDTPIEELWLRTTHANCSVTGQELRMLFERGGFITVVTIEVADATNRGVFAQLYVHIVEVDDPPLLLPVPTMTVEEDILTPVDLADYIRDEETPVEELKLGCAHWAVVGIEGVTLTLLYSTWCAPHDIRFTVSDGTTEVTGVFRVEVADVVDPIRIISVGGVYDPVVLELDEGTERYFRVVVEGGDVDNYEYSVASGWAGVQALSNGTLLVRAPHGDVGTKEAFLTVTSEEGAMDSLDLTIIVRDVNDPPDVPVILEPLAGSAFMEGQAVNFSASVHDPDVALGQVLWVHWGSNLSGPIRTSRSDRPQRFSFDRLTVGSHIINLTVSDGEHSRSATVGIIVYAAPVPPPPPREEPSFFTQRENLGWFLAIVLLVLLGVTTAALAWRRRAPEAPAVPPPAAEAPVVVPLAPKSAQEWVPDEDEGPPPTPPGS